MLSKEFPLRVWAWARVPMQVLLGEAFLGLLAITAVALTLFPILFSPGPATAGFINTAQWVIIAWFGVEYAVALAAAESKAAFLRNPWRWVDFATFVIPLASVVPTVSNLLRSTPVLRLIRLVRLVTLGMRASGVVVREHASDAAALAPVGPAQVLHVPAGAAPVATTWSGLVEWLRGGGSGWYHVGNPTSTELRAMAQAAGLSVGFLETHLGTAMQPHVATERGRTAVFVWYPTVDPASANAARVPMLIVVSKNQVLSISQGPASCQAAIAAELQAADTAAGTPADALASVLQRVVRANDALIGRFEEELRALEDVPVRESRAEFFERSFRVRKHLSAAQWDLWRLKAVLGILGGHGTSVLPMTEDTSAVFARLAADVDYLHETAVNTREQVLSVIELHLNVVSFDMNRVMRVLAVVSVLGLVPAVIGGILGMNLVDNPWPFTLPQVAFVISFGMLVTLYFFFVKGWLR